jgi:hypothetical protein
MLSQPNRMRYLGSLMAMGLVATVFLRFRFKQRRHFRGAA